MPVVAEPQHFHSTSPTYALTNGDNYTRRAGSSNYKDDSHRDSAPTGSQVPDTRHPVEHIQDPKRRPSFFRRINATMRNKSSSTLPDSTQGAPQRDSGSQSRSVAADPMYTAPSSSGPSRRPSIPANPVSRFRRAMNAGKSTGDHGREHEAVRERPFPSEEWRVDERTRQNGSALSRSQTDARGHNAPDNRNRSSAHSRSGSEGPWSKPQARRAPSEPVPRNASAGRHSPNTPSSHADSDAEYSRQYRSSPSQRVVPGRSHTAPTTSSGSPPRMGRYGIYASPVTSSTQIPSTPQHSQDKPLPRRKSQKMDQRHAPATIRVEGWEVQIEPPTPSSKNASTRSTHAGPSSYLRRFAQRRPSKSNSGSLTLVSDHPLMERPLPDPPDKMEKEQADEFARTLTQRMSVLLDMGDVDFTSPSALTSLPEEGTERSPSPGSSGTATPTGPPAKDTSPQPADGQPNAGKANTQPQPQGNSPFGTFLTNAREMNDAFVRGTGSVWDKIFGANKGKEEKEKANERAETPSNSDNAPDLRPHEAPGDAKRNSADQDMEGSRDIMLYSPLIPDSSSIVEVATSEVVTLYGDGADDARERAYRAELRRRWADGRGFISFDALSNIEPVQEETTASESTRLQAEPDSTVVGSVDPTDSKQTNDDSSKEKPREKVIWVPSPDKISVQVLWWGYRMWVLFKT